MIKSPRTHVSAGTAARRLGWSVETVRRWLKRGWIQGRRDPNGRFLVLAADVDKILSTHATNATPPSN